MYVNKSVAAKLDEPILNLGWFFVIVVIEACLKTWYIRELGDDS